MKISKDTLKMLRNFATINDNIYFEPGNLILTKSVANNITAETQIAEDFAAGFGIYSLNEFIGVLSLFANPDLSFTEKYVTITEGKNKVQYFGADKTILAIPKKRMSFDLVGAAVDVAFDLTADQFQQIIKTSGVLRAPDVTFKGNGKVMVAHISDAANTSSNSYSMELCDTTARCAIHFKVECLKMIIDDYNIAVSTKNIARFVGSNSTYHIATENDSIFN